MTFFLSFLAHLVGLAITFGAAYLWYRTPQSMASNWLLFSVVVLSLIMLTQRAHPVDIITYAIMTGGFGAGWYCVREKDYSGWLLGIAIVSAIVTIGQMF
jgi:hypothetical protein